MARLFVPFDEKGSAGHPHFQFPLCPSIEHAGHRGRAAAGSAGKRLAGTALPYAHLGMFPIQHLHKFRIHPSRESGMILKCRPELRDIPLPQIPVRKIQLFRKNYGVRVSHGNGSDRIRPAKDFQRRSDSRGCIFRFP